MEKDKDFSKDNAFLVEKSESERALIALPVSEGRAEESFRGGKDIVMPIILLCLAFFTCVGALICMIAFFAPNTSESVEYIEPQTQVPTEEEWRGAFLDRAICEKSLDCSVSVSSGALVGTGVLLSSDGWIVSSERIVTGESGRISVCLRDGREYEVESFKKDGDGLVYLKISASGLPFAERMSGELQNGETLIAVNGEGDIRTCSVSNPNGEKIKADISGDDGFFGAPLFAESGELAAVLIEGFENRKNSYAKTAKDLKIDFGK